MARVPNSARRKAQGFIGYATDKLRISNQCLRDSEQLVKRLTDEGVFDAANVTTFKNNKIQEAKDNFMSATKMILWGLGDFNVTVPAAFTDSEVDTENEDIRTHEDDT